MKNMNVNALVKLLGINPNTLRAWERRYKAVNPKRDLDGKRMYSAADVERVKCLMELVNRGHVIGKIAGLSTADLKRQLAQAEQYAEEVQRDLGRFDEEKMEQILSCLERFDLENLNILLHRARLKMGILDLISRLIVPLMVRVGDLVSKNKLSISQEHLLSSMLRDFLGGIHQSLSPYELTSRAASKSILICTREGDIHEFGILISAILSNLHRYKTFYLGTSMPMDDLLEAAQRFKVDAVLLGLTKIPKRNEIESSSQFVSRLDELLPRKVTLIIGGSDLESVQNINYTRKTYFLENIIGLEHILSQGI